ncbi:MAG TPA: short-chain dehydrogenase, partial [Acidimicrobiaceae bacterium]|nr:short-chain dehydrogenase [Acidimicrobiaceae bacterium]
MSTSLEGRVVIVTGAGRGIGRAIADRFAGAGATVIVNDIDAATADEAAAAINASGGTATAIVADVADSTQVNAMFDAVLA